LPSKGFNIFRPDGTKMFEIIKNNKVDWEIIKYLESGNEVDREIKKIKEFEALY
jgi:hypothetical protein